MDFLPTQALVLGAFLLFSRAACFDFVFELPSEIDNSLGCKTSQDKQLVADTLAEAIKNFADLTQPLVDPELDKDSRIAAKKEGELDITGSVGSNAAGCSTDSCRQCSGLLLDRLRLVGMIDDEEKDNLAFTLNATASASSDGCKRIKLADNDTVPLEQQQRVPRDADGSKGQQFTLKCVKAGDRLVEGEPWIGLCDMCWSWRKLPDGHSPQFLNEVTPGDRTKCLANHGTCRPMYRNVDASVSSSTTGSKTKTISMVRSVECNIKPDSDLLELARSADDADIIIRPRGGR